MRHLAINNWILPIRDQDATRLIEAGALYECGEEHDLHIVPDAPLRLELVEELVKAASLAATFGSAP